MFKDFKNMKDKEVLIGLVVIIILGSIALTLLIRREVGSKQTAPETAVEEMADMEEGMPVTEESTMASVIVEESASEEAEETKDEVALTNVQVVTADNTTQMTQEAARKTGLYDVLGTEKYVPATLTDRKQEDDQLKELYEYWDAYKLDAVADLVRLERLQKISKELEGKNQFYYYGSVDRLGRPSGKGLAVYADNNYYFGDWKEGLRHGKGMWLEVAIYTEENKNQNLGVIEHSYNGEWSKDLPNGQGQEHFSYDNSILKKDYYEDGKCIANVIGGFKDGYYHGEMYVMTIDSKGKSKDWGATCQNGVWDVIEKGNTTIAVWETYEKDENGASQYYYIYPNENHNYGIMGLKK